VDKEHELLVAPKHLGEGRSENALRMDSGGSDHGRFAGRTGGEKKSRESGTSESGNNTHTCAE
jgi:hypothetical protein